MTRTCQCGYPATPCDKTKHDYGHECVYGTDQLAQRLDNERHRRHALLMQEMVKTDRLEMRMFYGFVIAFVLSVLVLLGMML